MSDNVKIIHSDQTDDVEEYLRKIECFSFRQYRPKYYDEYADGYIVAWDEDDFTIYEKTPDGDEFWYKPEFSEETGEQITVKEKLKDGTIREYDDISPTKLLYEYIPNKYERRWNSFGELEYEKTNDGHETEWSHHPIENIKISETLPDGSKFSWNHEGKLLKGELPNGTKLKGSYYYRGMTYDENCPHYESIEHKYILLVERPDGITMQVQFSLSGKIEHIDVKYKGSNDLQPYIDKVKKQKHTDLEEKFEIQKQNKHKRISKSIGILKVIKEELIIALKQANQIKQEAKKIKENLNQGILDADQISVNFWQKKENKRS